MKPFTSMKQWEEDRPAGLTDEEAAQLVAEHRQSKDVRQARVVECAGRKHVQLDLKDGGIVTLNKDEAIHIEW